MRVYQTQPIGHNIVFLANLNGNESSSISITLYALVNQPYFASILVRTNGNNSSAVTTSKSMFQSSTFKFLKRRPHFIFSEIYRNFPKIV